MSVIISGIGATSFVMFHIYFKLNNKGNIIPNETSAIKNEENVPVELDSQSKIMHFLKMPLLYQTSLLWVITYYLYFYYYTLHDVF